MYCRYDLAMLWWERMPSKICGSLTAAAFCSSILNTFHIKTHTEELEVVGSFCSNYHSQTLFLVFGTNFSLRGTKLCLNLVSLVTDQPFHFKNNSFSVLSTPKIFFENKSIRFY